MPLDTRYPENHVVFLKTLDESRKIVELIARWLEEERGYFTQIPKERRAETQAEAEACSDYGDLLVRKPEWPAGEWRRIEVKSTRHTFTCAEDWARIYPNRTFLVIKKSQWDNADPKPYAIIHVSACGQYANVVWGKDQPHWTDRLVYDKRYRGPDAWQRDYFCPLHLVKFFPLKKKAA